MPALPTSLFLALNVAWLALELWLGVRRKSGGDARHDAGTLRLLHMAIYPAIALAVFIAFHRGGRLPESWHVPLLWASSGLIAAGLALRIWAIRTLDRFFTVDVRIHDGQELIGHGPYRHLRHPSYTGALLSFLGLAAGLGNPLSAGVLLVPVIAAFVVRIRVEERALAAAFPPDLPGLCAAAQAAGTRVVVMLDW
jgi:protein-S-isoprenylcysteine O-methyltransferase